MLNVALLRSGMINRNFNKNPISVQSTKDKKLDYYRLSYGFKDAHNSFLNNSSNSYKKKHISYNQCHLL